MPVANGTVTATTTRALVGTARSRRVQLTIQAPTSGTVYIGGSNVTTSNGRPLTAGDDPFVVYQLFFEDLTPRQEYYVVAGSSISVQYEEITT